MTDISPQKLSGVWSDGYALDFHTVSSIPVGCNEYGRTIFDTQYTNVGALLNKLKYKNDQSVIQEIVETSVCFIKSKSWSVDLVIPVPPSQNRPFQPVIILAEQIANELNITFCHDCIIKTKSTLPLKNVSDFGERTKLLNGVFQADCSKITGNNILLFDDLYRSGVTMNEIAVTLRRSGRVANIYAIALTKTRSHR